MKTWYCIDTKGVAMLWADDMLCADEDDARQSTKMAERTKPAAPVPLTDDVVQKIISKLEPLLDAKNQSWAEAERMLHGITAAPEKGNT